MEKEIRTYQTADGQVPFNTWLDKLKDTQARARIRTRIDRVSLGNFGDCKSVGEGVVELRIDYGPGYRVYMGQDGNHLIILLCGGDKSTQDKDINTAHTYWADYKSQDNA
jgi:putative addiction module killer protein